MNWYVGRGRNCVYTYSIAEYSAYTWSGYDVYQTVVEVQWLWELRPDLGGPSILVKIEVCHGTWGYHAGAFQGEQTQRKVCEVKAQYVFLEAEYVFL